jgi:hypothetical protein
MALPEVHVAEILPGIRTEDCDIDKGRKQRPLPNADLWMSTWWIHEGGFTDVRILMTLIAVGWIASAGGATQEDKTREPLERELVQLQKRLLTLKEQIRSLPIESTLREQKIVQARHAELDLEIVGEKLRALPPKSAPSAEGPAQVKLQEVELLESRYSPKRKSRAAGEGETLILRPTVTGLLAKEGILAFDFDVRLLDSDGKVALSEEHLSKTRLEDQFGSRSYVTFIGFQNLRGRTGKFTLELTVHDQNSGLKDTWQTAIEVQRPQFGIYNVYFSADEEGKHEIPSTFKLGGQRYVHFKVLGFLAQGGQLHLGDGFEIYDERDNRVFAQEGSKEGVQGKVPDDWIVKGSRKLNSVKVGDYTLRIIVLDRLSGNRTQRDVLFRVLPDPGY